jgi:hypothetical protein
MLPPNTKLPSILVLPVISSEEPEIPPVPKSISWLSKDETTCADDETTESPLISKKVLYPLICAEDETIPVPFVFAVAWTSTFPPLPKI